MSASNVLKFIKEKEAEFVDLRFTDPRGKLQHLTMDVTIVDDEMLNDGVFFDGSSIAGWKAINESDMILKPATARMFMDPFTSHNTVVLFCDILDAVKRSPYERDPRGVAKKAEEYLKSSGIGDKAFFGPEPEFFVFDDVRISNKESDVLDFSTNVEHPKMGGSWTFENNGNDEAIWDRARCIEFPIKFTNNPQGKNQKQIL